jgi:PadR family transcriptional regulator, regulatory protein PadR
MGKQKSADFRLSHSALKVLNMFFIDPRRELAGADLILGARVASGTLYPMLQRFEKAGWLSSKWEKGDPVVKGRPLRRVYRITSVGLAKTAAFRTELLGGVPA